MMSAVAAAATPELFLLAALPPPPPVPPADAPFFAAPAAFASWRPGKRRRPSTTDCAASRPSSPTSSSPVRRKRRAVVDAGSVHGTTLPSGARRVTCISCGSMPSPLTVMTVGRSHSPWDGSTLVMMAPSVVTDVSRATTSMSISRCDFLPGRPSPVNCVPALTTSSTAGALLHASTWIEMGRVSTPVTREKGWLSALALPW
mmetsp:Transcript_22332/g.69752  ORF Transcript_22332/g.69752 Transcript_22332/m.69752 type:complete len:202 (-) Transcript_22332:375-980(-)